MRFIGIGDCDYGSLGTSVMFGMIFSSFAYVIPIRFYDSKMENVFE
jgi:hypothetical protein